jgi:hypothetical protein
MAGVLPFFKSMNVFITVQKVYQKRTIFLQIFVFTDDAIINICED